MDQACTVHAPPRTVLTPCIRTVHVHVPRMHHVAAAPGPNQVAERESYPYSYPNP